jgi:hypothetical protein
MAILYLTSFSIPSCGGVGAQFGPEGEAGRGSGVGRGVRAHAPSSIQVGALSKLTSLEAELANGNDPSAQREIDRVKWVIGTGPDHIHVPKPA